VSLERQPEARFESQVSPVRKTRLSWRSGQSEYPVRSCLETCRRPCSLTVIRRPPQVRVDDQGMVGAEKAKPHSHLKVLSWDA
jgi:hypothetical protein